MSYSPEKLRMAADYTEALLVQCGHELVSVKVLEHMDQLRAHADALEKLKVMEEALRAIAQYHRDNSEHWAEMDAGLTMSTRDLSILHSGYAKVAEAPLAAIREKP